MRSFRLTHCKAQAESNVSDCIDAAVNSFVSDIDQKSKFWHHGAVDHADGKAQSSVRKNQVVDTGGQRNLV